MIPKKIHFTWFSKDPFPELVQQCMATWKEILPDYEFVHWDYERISHIDNAFLREALAKKKWAFAADFIRIYALYNEGGIYLDTDVELYKSFDNLLNLRAFIGRENSYHVKRRRAVRYLTSHCMGAEPFHPFFKSCLDYYNGRHFVLSEEQWLPESLRFDVTILPLIQFEMAKIHNYNPSESIKGVQVIDEGVNIFPNDFFDPEKPTKNSYCRHLAMGSWRNETKNFHFSWKQRIVKNILFCISNVLGALGIVAFRKL